MAKILQPVNDGASDKLNYDTAHAAVEQGLVANVWTKGSLPEKRKFAAAVLEEHIAGDILAKQTGLSLPGHEIDERGGQLVFPPVQLGGVQVGKSRGQMAAELLRVDELHHPGVDNPDYSRS